MGLPSTPGPGGPGVGGPVGKAGIVQESAHQDRGP